MPPANPQADETSNLFQRFLRVTESGGTNVHLAHHGGKRVIAEMGGKILPIS
jgi:hypothetical protein